MQTVSGNFMRASDLSKYLKNKTTQLSFQELIDEEVNMYMKQYDKIGSGIIVTFDEDEKVSIQLPDIKRLLQDVQQNKFKLAHLYYICDCLTMAEEEK